MGQAVANDGGVALSLNTNQGASQNVLSPLFNHELDEMIQDGEVVGGWIALECKTSCRARRNTSGKGNFPPPLRSAEKFIYGLPQPSANDKKLVRVGKQTNAMECQDVCALRESRHSDWPREPGGLVSMACSGIL